MTISQRRLVDFYLETRELAAEVVAALKLLKEVDLEREQLSCLIAALSSAPIRRDATFTVGGVINP